MSVTPEDVADSLWGASASSGRMRNSPYDHFIEDSATRHGVDPALIRAQMGQESTFKPNALSPKGASGLMQLMPATAQRLGVKNIYDPQQNIEGGVKYMRHLLDMFGGSVPLALAGYNAGERAVQKYGNKIPPYKETQDYVKKITFRYGGPGVIGDTPTSVANSVWNTETPDTPQSVASSVWQAPEAVPTPAQTPVTSTPEDVANAVWQPTTTPPVSTPVMPSALTKPTDQTPTSNAQPETPDTIQAQIDSIKVPGSTRFAVMPTSEEQSGILANSPNLTPITFGKDARTIWVDTAKAKKIGLKDPEHIKNYLEMNPKGLMTALGTPSAPDVGDATTGTAVTTNAAPGVEGTSTIVTHPSQIPAVAAEQKSQFPQGQTQVVPSQAVVQGRAQPNAPVENPTPAQFQAQTFTPPPPQFNPKAFAQANAYLKSQGQAPITKEQYLATQQGTPSVSTSLNPSDFAINGAPVTSDEFTQAIPTPGGGQIVTAKENEKVNRGDPNNRVAVYQSSPNATEEETFKDALTSAGASPEGVDNLIQRMKAEGSPLIAGGYTPGQQVNVLRKSLTDAGVPAPKTLEQLAEEQKQRLLAAPDDATYRNQAIQQLTDEKKLDLLGRLYSADPTAKNLSEQDIEAKLPSLLSEDEIAQKTAELKSQELSQAEKESRYNQAQGYEGNLGAFQGGLSNAAGDILHQLGGVVRPFSSRGYQWLQQQGNAAQLVAPYRNQGEGAKDTGETIAQGAGEMFPQLLELIALPGGAKGKFAFLGASQAAGEGKSSPKVAEAGLAGYGTGKVFGAAEAMENPLARLGTVFGGSAAINAAQGMPVAQNIQSSLLNTAFEVQGTYGEKALNKFYRFWQGGEPYDLHITEKGGVDLLPTDPNRQITGGEVITDPKNPVYDKLANAKAKELGIPVPDKTVAPEAKTENTAPEGTFSPPVEPQSDFQNLSREDKEAEIKKSGEKVNQETGKESLPVQSNLGEQSDVSASAGDTSESVTPTESVAKDKDDIGDAPIHAAYRLPNGEVVTGKSHGDIVAENPVAHEGTAGVQIKGRFLSLDDVQKADGDWQTAYDNVGRNTPDTTATPRAAEAAEPTGQSENPWVTRAKEDHVVDIGQLKPEDVKALNKAVKNGELQKGKGGGFPSPKTVYAAPDFDISGHHAEKMAELQRAVSADRGRREQAAESTPSDRSPVSQPERNPELENVYSQASRKERAAGELETAAQQKTAAFKDLQRAKQTLKDANMRANKGAMRLDILQKESVYKDALRREQSAKATLKETPDSDRVANIDSGQERVPPDKILSKGYGDKNVKFTRDKADAAKALLLKKFGGEQTKFGAGLPDLDAETLQAIKTLAGYHLEAGLTKLGDLKDAVAKEVGDWVRPHIDELYPALRDEKGESKVGKSIAQKAVDRNEPVDLAKYDTTTDKKRAAAAEDLVTNHPDQMRRILNGDEKLPAPMLGAFIKRVEEHAETSGNKDYRNEVIRKLQENVVPQTSEVAQALQGLGVRDPDSVTALLNQVKANKLEAAGSYKIGLTGWGKTDPRETLRELQARNDDLEKRLAETGHEPTQVSNQAYIKQLWDTAKAEAKGKSKFDKMVSDARTRQQAKSLQMSSGFTPQDVIDWGLIAADHLVKGVKAGADLADALAKQVRDSFKDKDKGDKFFDENIKPNLDEITQHAKDFAQLDTRSKLTPDQIIAKEGAKDNLPLDPDKNLVGSLVNAHIREGAEPKDVIPNVTKDLRQLYPDVEEKDVHNVFSDYRNDAAPNKNDLIAKRNEVKRISTLASKLADVQDGNAPWSPIRPGQTKSEYVQEKEAELDQAMKDAGIPPSTKIRTVEQRQSTREKQLQKQLDMLQAGQKRTKGEGVPDSPAITRLKNAIADEKAKTFDADRLAAKKRLIQNTDAKLQRKIASGDYSEPVKNPVPVDAESQRLQKALDSTKQQLKTLQRLTNITPEEISTLADHSARLKELATGKDAAGNPVLENGKPIETTTTFKSKNGDITLPYSEEYVKELAKTRDYINSLTPASRLMRLATDFRNSMLTAIHIPVKVVVETGINRGIEEGVDSLIHLDLKGSNSAAVQQYVSFVRRIQKETGYNLAAMHSFNEGNPGMMFGENFMHFEGPGKIRAVEKAVNKAVIDWAHGIPFTYQYAGRFGSFINREATSIAKSEGLTGDAAKARATSLMEQAMDFKPSDPIAAKLKADGQMMAARVTNTNDTWGSRFGNGYKNLLNKVFPHLGDMTVPFSKIPGSLVANAIDVSGGGFIRGPVLIAKAIADAKKTGNQVNLRPGITAMVRAAGGMGAAALLASTIGPDDYDAKRRMVRIGGKNGIWVSTDLIGPIGPSLNGFLQVKFAPKGEQTASGRVYNYLSGVGAQIKELPGATQVDELLSRGAPAFGKSFVTGRVPGILKDAWHGYLGAQQPAQTTLGRIGNIITPVLGGTKILTNAGKQAMAPETISRMNEGQIKAARYNDASLNKAMDSVEYARQEDRSTPELEEELLTKLQRAEDKGALSPENAERANKLLKLDGANVLKGSASAVETPNFDHYNKDADGFIEKVSDWAKGMALDPVDAFDKLFKNESIKRMENGTIIVQRMAEKDSAAERKKQGGGGKEVKLDHTKPLEIGGTNDTNNLRLVTTSQWASYTPMENYLAYALHDEKITGSDARQMIVDWKQGKLTTKEVVNKVGRPYEGDVNANAILDDPLPHPGTTTRQKGFSTTLRTPSLKMH